MKKSPLLNISLSICAIASFFSACNSDTQFKGSGKWGGLRMDKASTGYSKATGDATATTYNRGIQVSCSSNVATVQGTGSLNIPVICSTETKSTVAGYLDMDIVFVMDTTGSMRKYVDLVRRNLAAIEANAIKNGFKVRFGAISFGDEIYDTRLLSEGSAEASTAMLETNPSWRPVEDRGGTAPEIGLGAIEKGLEVLTNGSGKSKVLVFYTDGPAKRLATDRDSLTTSFFVGTTAEKLRESAKVFQQAGGIFRFASGTSCSRGDSWFSEWPAPCEQISELAGLSGVRHLPLIFGQSDSNYDGEFVTSLENKESTVSVDCKLSSLKISDSSGKTLLPETPISPNGEGMWQAPLETGLSSGEFVATITRTCPDKKTMQAVTINVSGK